MTARLDGIFKIQNPNFKEDGYVSPKSAFPLCPGGGFLIQSCHGTASCVAAEQAGQPTQVNVNYSEKK
jgi:hypothetical protein